MNRKQHIQITEIFFNGRGYEEVHQWLDELFPKYMGFGHWKERHHLKALEDKYGYNTPEYYVGMLHIICDWFSHCREIILPNTREEIEHILEEFMLE